MIIQIKKCLFYAYKYYLFMLYRQLSCLHAFAKLIHSFRSIASSCSHFKLLVFEISFSPYPTIVGTWQWLLLGHFFVVLLIKKFRIRFLPVLQTWRAHFNRFTFRKNLLIGFYITFPDLCSFESHTSHFESIMSVNFQLNFPFKND